MKTETGLRSVALLAALLTALLAASVLLLTIQSANAQEIIESGQNDGAEAAAPVEIGGTEAAPNRVIVAYENDATKVEKREVISETAAASPVSLRPGDGSGDTVVAEIESGSVVQAIEEIEANPGVLYAEPDYAMTTDFVPNDPFVESGEQYNLKRVKAYEAFDGTNRGEMPGPEEHAEIGVLDSGQNTYHEDLSGKIRRGLDCVNDGVSPFDDDTGHGTGVASVAAGFTNNGKGLAAGAPRADVFALRVASGGTAYTSDVIQCGNYAVFTVDVEVLNYSYGGTGYSQSMADAIETWYTEGTHFVTSAGNDDCSTSSYYPRDYPYAIGVGAVDRNNVRADYSNCRGVDLVAPGSDIVGAWHEGGYVSFNGTSFSAPLVAAGFAGCRAEGFGIRNCEQRAFSTTRDLGAVGRDSQYGHGLVNFDRWWK